MPKTITGYIVLDENPTHACTFRTHRHPSGAIDIEITYRHTGTSTSEHARPGSDLYMLITRLFDGLSADRGDEGAKILRLAIS